MKTKLPKRELLAALNDVIKRLRSEPNLLQTRNWDSVAGLRAVEINQLASQCGIGPLMDAVYGPPWWSFPNLPADHPANQMLIDHLKVFDPASESEPVTIRRFCDELDPSPEKSLSIVLEKLKAWRVFIRGLKF